MEVRRIRRRVPGRPDVADDVATRDDIAFLQVVRVAIQVRVVVAIGL
jgi:hypothetical protein